MTVNGHSSLNCEHLSEFISRHSHIEDGILEFDLPLRTQVGECFTDVTIGGTGQSIFPQYLFEVETGFPSGLMKVNLSLERWVSASWRLMFSITRAIWVRL